jgi:hypothetical protein
MPDPPFETFLTSRGLKSLRQKGCHMLGTIQVLRQQRGGWGQKIAFWLIYSTTYLC